VTTSPPPDDQPAPHAERSSRAPARPVAPAQFGLSLQLSRASMMALTRLQLALQSGDRQATMAAMDRLHSLDAEMERLVDRLPERPGEDTEWSAISRHVSDQKLAIAFEKLALASEISGPDLVSRGAVPTIERSAANDADGALADPPPLRDWPILPDVQPTVWKSIPAGIIGFVLALAVTVGIVAAVLLLTR
jgi:hypothetical protein